MSVTRVQCPLQRAESASPLSPSKKKSSIADIVKAAMAQAKAGAEPASGSEQKCPTTPPKALIRQVLDKVSPKEEKEDDVLKSAANSEKVALDQLSPARAKRGLEDPEEKESPRGATARKLEQVNLSLSPSRPSTRSSIRSLETQSSAKPRIQSLAARLAKADQHLHRQDQSGALSGLLGISPIALKHRPAHYDNLKQLLDVCRNRFAELADANSEKRIGQGVFLPKGFRALKEVFLSVESKEFLDLYIIRHSQIAAVQDPELKAKFADFEKKIEHLKTVLNDMGITGVAPGKTVNFWSGPEGQKMAAAHEAMSDSDVRLTNFLFACWKEMQKMDHLGVSKELATLLPILFSAIFASYAVGGVHVFMSSTNDGVQSIVNNRCAFWESELYALLNNPLVSHIYLHLYQGKDEEGNDKWAPPIDLKSSDPAIVKYRDEVILLSRRGEKDLKVPMGTLKEMLSKWNTGARMAKLTGFEAEC